jgi:NAD(P)-dependent dehydrogenase (short-subunit alcohol dehydrogenase family)
MQGHGGRIINLGSAEGVMGSPISASYAAAKAAVHAWTRSAAVGRGTAPRLGRGSHGDPARDLGPMLVFLAGDGARFITGQLLAVDGGLMMLGA